MQNKRVFLIVIDSFGIGSMPDATQYDDEYSNTYMHILKKRKLNLPTLSLLGLNAIDGVKNLVQEIDTNLINIPIHEHASYARLAEKAPAKDTTAGHYEIAGLSLQQPYKVYKNFSPEILKKLTNLTGYEFIGNKQMSGTEIIQELGEEHKKTSKIIVYTSQDSVMQFAANTAVIPLEKLYAVCKCAREVMVGENTVARIIARPFVEKDGQYIRTKDRKDFSLSPPGKTLLDILKANKIPVISVGKINDIFNGQGITKSYASKGNKACLERTKLLLETEKEGLIFINLVDTDMLYGHRNDVAGYANSLEEIDIFLHEFIKQLKDDDYLLITADHGCDPSTPSTDHSREYVPLMIYSHQIQSKNLGTLQGFDVIANFIQAVFEIQADSLIYDKIINGG